MSVVTLNYFILSIGDEESADYLGPNEGDEAHPYLRFIIDHYDHLPRVSWDHLVISPLHVQQVHHTYIRLSWLNRPWHYSKMIQ
jgi:hypothetical protein